MEDVLTSLKLWIDPVPRSGPENMAVDDLLLETAVEPIMRIYTWEDRWGSLGCFCGLKQAIEVNPQILWVRRSTGGGVVDHQDDWTYSLIIPGNEHLARISASESYRIIHTRLSLILSDRFKLVDGSPGISKVGGICFREPVISDVVDSDGKKVAGAGQRRTRHGLLHQGSVAGHCSNSDSVERSIRFAGALTERWLKTEFVPPSSVIVAKVRDKYGADEWTRRR